MRFRRSKTVSDPKLTAEIRNHSGRWFWSVEINGSDFHVWLRDRSLLFGPSSRGFAYTQVQAEAEACDAMAAIREFLSLYEIPRKAQKFTIEELVPGDEPKMHARLTTAINYGDRYWWDLESRQVGVYSLSSWLSRNHPQIKSDQYRLYGFASSVQHAEKLARESMANIRHLIETTTGLPVQKPYTITEADCVAPDCVGCK